MKILALILAFAFFSPRDCSDETADDRQAQQQQTILQQGTSSVGMPNIRNFRERRIVKDILELRDQQNYRTYTYQLIEGVGIVFLCNSMGFPISSAMQFTNPEYIADYGQGGFAVLPQADPNGLFSPDDAEGSWVMCIPPGGGNATVVYSEPRLITAPFRLPYARVLEASAEEP